MKRPLSRSQRGSKRKHILQICVLLGVCIWLIYQVKYSHEKNKKQIYEKDIKKSSESEDRFVKLGRKDLLPGYNNQKENEKHLEEEDEDEEEIKHEGEEKEEEEDEIDEQDQSKIAGETDKDEDYFEEDKEIRSNEVHYKADDASSAVSHESRILNTKKLKESSQNSNETAQENNNNEVETRKEPILKDSDSKSANSTEAILEASRFLKNETEIMLDRSQEDIAPPAGLSDLKTVLKLEQTTNESDLNITISANRSNKDSIQDESTNSTLESSLLEKNSGLNSTKVKENSRFEDDDDELGKKESSNLFSTEESDDSSKHSI